MKRAESIPVVDLDEYEHNEDWILTPEVRAEEIAISEKLAAEHAEAKALTEEGKVQTTGKPLPAWGDEPVPITAEDVAEAIREWDRTMPPEYRGMLTAEPVPEDTE